MKRTLGTCYYPEHWPEAQWAEDAARMAGIVPAPVLDNPLADHRPRGMELTPRLAPAERPTAHQTGQIAPDLLQPYGTDLAKIRLDAIESILGPDLLLWSCEYFIKEANSRNMVSWHQDLTYWGMDGSDHEVTAWVALSPATEHSGCMKFVAGSHRESLVPHTDTFADNNLLSRGQEIAVEVDEEDATIAALKPGQMSLHHGRMFHASGPNTTNR